MNTTLNIITDVNSVPWLRLCLKSIKKFVSGWEKICITCGEERSDIERIARDFDVPVCVDVERSKIDSFHLEKSHSFFFAAEHIDTEYVATTAPHFLFTKEFNLDDMFVNRKPVILMDSYANLAKMDGEIYKAVTHWQKSTERILGINRILYEFMRRIPIVHAVSSVRATKDYLLSKSSETNMVDYLNAIKKMGLKNGFEFSELNIVGAYMYENYNHDYVWIDLSNDVGIKQFIPPTFACVNKVALSEKEAESAVKELAYSNMLPVNQSRNIISLLENSEK